MSKKKRKAAKGFLFTLCICLLFVAGLFTGRSILKTLYPIRYADFVEMYALEYEIDKNLLYAVIETESGFDKDAVSYAGAVGLTQILPDTFEWLQGKAGESLESDALKDPEVSIKYGAMFYGILMKEYKSVNTAAAAYHAGMGRVDGWLEDSEYSSDGKTLEVIPYSSTDNYVKKIVKAMTIYEKLY